MMRGLSRFASVIACAWAAWQPSLASAAEEDVQLWVYAVARGDFDEDTSWALDGSARWREQGRGDEQQTLRLNIDQQVDDGVRIGGGFGVFETEGGITELRPHQQVTLSKGRFSARTRVEQRFFDGADRMELRLRQMVRYTLPLGQGWRASIDGEFLHLAQRRNRLSTAPRDQWRARTIVTREVSESLSLGAGYMLIYNPRGARTDRINHVPQLYLTKRF
ncbi:hypothetical protein NAP1_08010 [Erythrobacter sp. NAP1]|uniref:DUF2490 domain-containing protein n=1 Tax=Erythrobacter sp. NAP1 TaxID=237727 RepID=UPI0000686BEC|nr:DUF2490 domain-containing protein [Erythrobacter sp. NAP1]EAQ30708.1 hypothetical protein NAP1_08010 [Erythrobacter sp. NAP1]